MERRVALAIAEARAAGTLDMPVVPLIVASPSRHALQAAAAAHAASAAARGEDGVGEEEAATWSNAQPASPVAGSLTGSAEDEESPPLDVIFSSEVEHAVDGKPLPPPRPGAQSGETRADKPVDEPLPPLDQMVERIPAEVRATLEELFRARFVKVVKVPESALKTAESR